MYYLVPTYKKKSTMGFEELRRAVVVPGTTSSPW
jgi:hypothetical protein